MQIGIRAHDCVPAPFEQLIKNVKDQDLKCIQLALRFAIKDHATDTCAMTTGLAMHLKRILAKNEVDVAVLGCYYGIATDDPVELSKITEIYKAHIRFASILGAGVVGTETPGFSTIGGSDSFKSDEALEVLIKNLRPIVEYAEKMGVILALECVHAHVIYDMKRMRKVLDAINSPNLQVIFDPINVFTPENYVNQDEIMKEAFEIAGDDITIIHAKDFTVEDGKIIPAQYGKGLFHYDVLMKWIKERKPYIQVLMEETVPETAIASRDLLLEYYNKA